MMPSRQCLPRMLITGAAVALAVLLLSAPASGQSISIGTGSGFTIDDSDDGGIGIFLSTFSVAPGSPQDVVPQSLTLTINDFNHTFVGDLQVYLVHDPLTPGDDSDDVFSPVFINVSPPPEISGDASDLGGDYTFADGGASLWDTAAALDGTQAIPAGTYQPADADFTGSDPVEVPVSFDDTFSGLSTAGEWGLVVYDIVPPVDFGSVGSFTVDVVPVPEPASLALAGALPLLLLRRR